MNNKYDDWNEIKKDLQEGDKTNIYFKEGDIWWTFMGQNIGNESFGKGEKFSRPILVLKKISSDSCIAIPLSTKIKEGSWYYKYNFKGKEYTALLYQLKMMSKKRFQRKLGELDEKDFLEIKNRLRNFLNL